MRVYKVKQGIVLEEDNSLFLLENQNWDAFINDDNLFEKIEKAIKELKPLSQGRDVVLKEIQAPIQNQEVWASGVTYLRSKVGRQEESKNAGGSDFYARVYEAERPELFFKSTPGRVAAPGGKVRIRKDSTWDVPEPELTLVITSSGKIVGYTIGNDMSSRSIEGENPLYLPQAKTYDGCAALGPCIFVTQKPLPENTSHPTKFTSVPIGSMVIVTLSPFSRVNSFPGTFSMVRIPLQYRSLNLRFMKLRSKK